MGSLFLKKMITGTVRALILFIAIGATPGLSEDEKDKNLLEKKRESLKEEKIETLHTAKIQGKEISYKATAGNILLKDEKGEIQGNIFYIAYTKEDTLDLEKRPITFSFNGGPGSSSVWLHLGALGPMRIAVDEKGLPIFPYHVENNDYSLLDETDLVFIDPISTGYSRAFNLEQAKLFHGVEEDIKSVAEFIRIYTTRHDRWSSPKFLAGESYGTTRAAGLSLYLHDYYNMSLNGLILISSALNYQAFDFKSGNDLAYINFLPAYTATAWYHHKLPPDLQDDLPKTLREVQEFALKDYNLALMRGDRLTTEEREEIIQKLAQFTSLSPKVISQCNLRVPMSRFSKELLKEEGVVIGRFDGRIKGWDYNKSGETCSYDPSLEFVAVAFTSAVNQYFRKDLKWDSDEEYRILADVSPWNFGKVTNQYLNMMDSLREVMTKNPYLKIIVASGIYDLATPYFSSEYMYSHLNLDPSLRDHVQLTYYDAGHMMFLHPPSLIKLKQDVASFIQAAK